MEKEFTGQNPTRLFCLLSAFVVSNAATGYFAHKNIGLPTNITAVLTLLLYSALWLSFWRDCPKRWARNGGFFLLLAYGVFVIVRVLVFYFGNEA